MFLVVGVLLGLLLGLVLAFVRDAFDDRIRDAAQFEQKLGAPTLAVLPPGAILPYNGAEAGWGGGASPRWSSRSPAQRARRRRRCTRCAPMLAAMAMRRDLRTLLVVAADPSVSASQLAAGLGVALAESRRRVLLVAADLRGSTLPQIFDVPSTRA